MVIFNVWFCYLKSVFLLKINSFPCTCSCSILCIYYNFLYFRIFFDIRNEKSYIFFSIASGFEKKLRAQNTIQIRTWFTFGPQIIY
jgi:hypothetical protein